MPPHPLVRAHGIPFLAALALILGAAEADLQAAEAITPPLIHQIPDPWPWGGKVDESCFAPGGAGVTIHAAPDGKKTASGAADDPFDLTTACAAVESTMRSVTQGAEALGSERALPLWLSVTRRGDAVTFALAPDQEGKPAAWIPSGTQKLNGYGKRVAVGLLASGLTWPKPDQGAEATVDRLKLEAGSQAKPLWAATRVGMDRGARSKVAVDASGSITLVGTGESLRWMNPYGSAQSEDSGQGWYASVEGDFTLTLRVAKLTTIPADGPAFLACEVRRDTGWKSEREALELSLRNQGSTGTVLVHRAWRRALPTPGRPARLVLQPGVYRQPLALPNRDRIARDLPLVIEGAKVGGQTGKVILSGDESEGFEPDTWRSGPDNTVEHELPAAWLQGNAKDLVVGLCLKLPDGDVRVVSSRPSAKNPINERRSGVLTLDLEQQRLTYRLPEGLAGAAFRGSEILVTRRRAPLLQIGRMNSGKDMGNSVVLRNLVFQCVAGDAVAIHDWVATIEPSRNHVFEDLVFRWNLAHGFLLSHIESFTARRLRVEQNLSGSGIIAADGLIEDCVWQGNVHGGHGIFANVMRNVLARSCRFIGNGGGWRMDHVSENVVVDGCEFRDNRDGPPVFLLETAIGPTTIRNCSFINNSTRSDGVVALSTAHNVSLIGCIFQDNLPAAIELYPRSRAHTPVKQYDDEMANNLDRGAWDARNTLTGRWGPAGKKPASLNRNLVIAGCTFTATDPKALFISQNRYKRPENFFLNISQELRAWNNRYWNPANPLAFPGSRRVEIADPTVGDSFPERPIDFAAWRAQSAQPDFEAGSVWGEQLDQPVAVVPATSAASGSNPRPQVDRDGFRYRAAELPFTARRAVLPWEHDGRPYHHLQVDQIGTYADSIDYAFELPEDGRFALVFEYLQHAAPFRYLGFAQVALDGIPLGEPIDQSGLTTQAIAAPLGLVDLRKGRHRLTVTSVWRNGYTSGDYDLTIGGFALLRQLPLRPAGGQAWHAAGLLAQTVVPRVVNTLRRVDWSTAVAAPVQTQVGVCVTGKGAQRLAGLLRVPKAGLWQLGLRVVGAGEVYLNGDLVIDCDGQHWGEKDEAWQKTVTLALAQGDHALRVDALVQTGAPALELVWRSLDGEGGSLEPVKPEALGHAAAVP